MIIIITPEKNVKKETAIINELFQEGLELLHIRKPFMSLDEMKDFIWNINSEFHHQLALCSHYELVEQFEISRLHFSETDRNHHLHTSFPDKIMSTSVHDIESFNELDKNWEYSLVSPVFPSISKKGYGKNATILNDIRKRSNADVKLVALGGINEYHIHEVFESGADGVALLGAIWEIDNPLNGFRQCRQAVRQKENLSTSFRKG
ncbi:thiamine phosphate synthase [Chryseobacterium gregarium]|uniref:thiamine phosphate synthase n=1 Tax=Chryseobacterium gregarium TaxID=456299 RepID=UPI00041E4EAF|nr:thiamine phosphate synthase [Chryseobacterium gregarium]